jgi:hypothetical protein
LDAEIQRVALAPQGERNDSLNVASYNLGQLVGGGYLARREVEAALWQAADQCALVREDGQRQTEATIASGVDAGIKQPRRRPDRGPVPAAPTEPAPEAPGEPLFDYHHLIAPKPTEWLIDGLLPLGGCYVIAAEPKAYKTWLSLDIALALASHSKVLGCRATRRARTLLISPEGTRQALANRLHALDWGRGVDAQETGPYIPIWRGRFRLNDAQHIKRLYSAIAKADIDLLVLDPLVSAMSGVDENSVDQVQPLLDQLRDLLGARPGLTLLVVHHSAKSTQGRSQLYAMRGSSAIAAWADGVISLRYDDADGLRRIDTVFRDALSGSPIGFTLLWPDSEVEGMQGASLVRCDIPCPTRKERSDGNVTRDAILAELSQCPALTIRTLADRLCMGKSAIHRQIQILVARSMVERAGDGFRLNRTKRTESGQTP